MKKIKVLKPTDKCWNYIVEKARDYFYNHRFEFSIYPIKYKDDKIDIIIYILNRYLSKPFFIARPVIVIMDMDNIDFKKFIGWIYHETIHVLQTSNKKYSKLTKNYTPNSFEDPLELMALAGEEVINGCFMLGMEELVKLVKTSESIYIDLKPIIFKTGFYNALTIEAKQMYWDFVNQYIEETHN